MKKEEAAVMRAKAALCKRKAEWFGLYRGTMQKKAQAELLVKAAELRLEAARLDGEGEEAE